MLLKTPSSVQFSSIDDTTKACRYAEAIRYAVDNGARIINWSGTLNDNSKYAAKAISEAFKYAGENDVLVVISVGSNAKNLDLPGNFAVPASINMSNVVKVTELNFQGDLYTYTTAAGDTLGSSFGEKSVTIGAIGENYTTWDYHSRSYYALGAGTSCAGPIVAGCAALMLSVNADLSPSRIHEILIETAIPLESLKGITESGGAVNICGAVKKSIEMKTSPERDHIK
jgi:subtilisin family serine protease